LQICAAEKKQTKTFVVQIQTKEAF